MEEKGKTIKQIAEELGVSKTAIYKKIDNLGLRSSLRKIANQFTVDKTQEKLIIQAFLEKQSQTKIANQVYENDNQSQTSLQLISMLQKELDIKNKQIEDLTATVKSLSQSINADRHGELAKFIEGKLIDGGADPQAETLPQEKKSLFHRLFGKGK